MNMSILSRAQRWLDIQKLPTAVSTRGLYYRRLSPTNGVIFAGVNANAIHESCLRAYPILQEVKALLEANVPGGIVLDLISLMEQGSGGDYDVIKESQ